MHRYTEYRAKQPTYFKEGETPVDWDFADVFVFARFDAFHTRVATIKVLVPTNILVYQTIAELHMR